MKILKKENWWTWLLLTLFSQGSSTLVLGALLDVYKKDAWYTNWKYWVLGIVCLFFPFTIMIAVFSIQILCLTAAKLDVPGKEIYLSPYLWILACIIPFIGWFALVTGIVYLEIWILVELYYGKAEKYIK